MELDREKVAAWINEKWEGPIFCPVCQHNDWNIPDRVWEAREFVGGDLVIGGGQRVLPLVSIMCNFCGHTLMFNALAMGVVEPAKKKEEG